MNFRKEWLACAGLVCTLATTTIACAAEDPNASVPRDAAPRAAMSSDVLVQGLTDSDRVAGQFIVVFRKEMLSEYRQRSQLGAPESALSAFAEEVSSLHGAVVSRVYGAALDGFVLSGASDKQAEQLALDPRIEHVEADRYATLFQYQSSPRWGLDRIDQRDLPFSNSYSYPNTGAGINVYVIDSGVYPNSDFGGRVNSAGGYTAVNDGYGTNDCDGHGTHVAGIVGSYTYGVAKSVNIYPVRVFGCDASSAPISQVIAGVNWVTSHRIKPAIANMSLGYTGSSSALDQATQSMINSGVVVVAAAGNSSGDACNVSPAKVAAVITVGGSTDTDAMYNLSNFGTCVDVYAPATGIKSTYNTGPMSTAILDGTSMASPHVAGVAANYLASHATAAPATVATYIRETATTRKILNYPGGPYCTNANALLYNGPQVPAGAPGTPSNLQAERICNGNYRMTWDAGPLPVADTYEIYRTVSSAPGCEGYVISSTSRFINVSTPAGFLSKFRVRGCNSAGCSAYSLPESITPYSGCQ